MINQNIIGIKGADKIECMCDKCKKIFKRDLKVVLLHRKLGRINDYCISCAASLSASKKPQCNKKYWTKQKREIISKSIKSSKKYCNAIAIRDTSGKKNSMYGKKHTIKTKNIMSKIRTGKIGINATAWKGGKTSINARVKKIIHERYNWYKRVFERDCFVCILCGSNIKLDAHHIVPISRLIKMLIKDKIFANDTEKVYWLVDQPEIKDENLTNGITYCRKCHKAKHKNWGSHKQ